MKKVRLIEANALHAKIYEDSERSYGAEANIAQVLLRIETAPTIEAESVRRGRWKKKNGEIYCTNCKKSKWSESFELMLSRFNFCPNCGAYMRETSEYADDN